MRSRGQGLLYCWVFVSLHREVLYRLAPHSWDIHKIQGVCTMIVTMNTKIFVTVLIVTM